MIDPRPCPDQLEDHADCSVCLGLGVLPPTPNGHYLVTVEALGPDPVVARVIDDRCYLPDFEGHVDVPIVWIRSIDTTVIEADFDTTRLPDAVRRWAWVDAYTEVTGDLPLGPDDLHEAMCEEARHWSQVSDLERAELSPEMFEHAEALAEKVRGLGFEDFADVTAPELILASSISNMIESGIAMNKGLGTPATRTLTRDDGLGHCLYLARMVAAIRSASTQEQCAAAVAQCVLPVVASLTESNARRLSRLRR